MSLLSISTVVNVAFVSEHDRMFLHECAAAYQNTVEQLVKDKMPKKSGRWWFSWRRRDMSRSQVRTMTIN